MSLISSPCRCIAEGEKNHSKPIVVHSKADLNTQQYNLYLYSNHNTAPQHSWLKKKTPLVLFGLNDDTSPHPPESLWHPSQCIHHRGRFRTAWAQRVHSANYYVVYPGNTPENHPPTEACMVNSKQHGVQNSGRLDPWPLVVENSRLFAQRTVRPHSSLGTKWRSCDTHIGSRK